MSSEENRPRAGSLKDRLDGFFGRRSATAKPSSTTNNNNPPVAVVAAPTTSSDDAPPVVGSSTTTTTSVSTSPEEKVVSSQVELPLSSSVSDDAASVAVPSNAALPGCQEQEDHHVQELPQPTSTGGVIELGSGPSHGAGEEVASPATRPNVVDATSDVCVSPNPKEVHNHEEEAPQHQQSSTATSATQPSSSHQRSHHHQHRHSESQQQQQHDKSEAHVDPNTTVLDEGVAAASTNLKLSFSEALSQFARKHGMYYSEGSLTGRQRSTSVAAAPATASASNTHHRATPSSATTPTSSAAAIASTSIDKAVIRTELVRWLHGATTYQRGTAAATAVGGVEDHHHTAAPAVSLLRLPSTPSDHSLLLLLSTVHRSSAAKAMIDKRI